MKIIALFVFLLPVFVYSQDTSSCQLLHEKDKFTNEVRLTTGFILLPFATLSIQATEKEIDFFFTLSGEDKCFNYESTVMVFFEGGKLKTNFKNTGTVNCDGYFHFSFRNGETVSSLLERIATKKMISLKFTGANQQESVITLSAEQQQTVMNMAACIIKNAKMLLK
jgi:hypothetical protein